MAGQQQQQSAAVVWGQLTKPGIGPVRGLRVTLVVRQRGLLLFAALELVLELEEGLAASTAAVWSSSAQLQWFGQCGRLCHVLVSCSHARVLNFSVPPAAAPGAGALLAMVVRLLG